MNKLLYIAGLDQLTEDEEFMLQLEGLSKEDEVADLLSAKVFWYVADIIKRSGLQGINPKVVMRMIAKKYK